jgi:antitoxin YefM
LPVTNEDRAPKLAVALIDVLHRASVAPPSADYPAKLPRDSSNLPILLAMDELPLADARNRLSELVAEVEKTHARVTITKHGHPAAVLVSPEDLASLEETVDILSDPEALAAIREAEAEYARGDFTTGEEMRRLIEERRRRESGAA